MFTLGKNEVLVEYVPKAKQRYNKGYPLRYTAKDLKGKIQKFPESDLDCTCCTANDRYDCPSRFYTASAYFGYVFYIFQSEKKLYKLSFRNKYFLEEKDTPENRQRRYYNLVKVKLYGRISRLVRKELQKQMECKILISNLPWDLYHIFTDAINEVWRVKMKNKPNQDMEKYKDLLAELRHGAEMDILFQLKGRLQQIRVFDWNNVRDLFYSEWER